MGAAWAVPSECVHEADPTALQTDRQHGRGIPALPWPEAPLLSTAEQHRVQRRERAQPSDVQRSDPGAIELKGNARHPAAGTSDRPRGGPEPRADRHTERRADGSEPWGRARPCDSGAPARHAVPSLKGDRLEPESVTGFSRGRAHALTPRSGQSSRERRVGPARPLARRPAEGCAPKRRRRRVRLQSPPEARASASGGSTLPPRSPGATLSRKSEAATAPGTPTRLSRGPRFCGG